MIYLVRHATPDWSRLDIPYSQPPGPPLTAQGEAEARGLGEFLREAGVKKIYASPFERTRRTAELAAEAAGLAFVEAMGLSEWRPGETEKDVQGRLWPFWQAVREADHEAEPVALVMHGGPIALVLTEMGMEANALIHYRRLFDRNNPVPPAGVWRVGGPNDLNLVYMPEVYRKKEFLV